MNRPIVRCLLCVSLLLGPLGACNSAAGGEVKLSMVQTDGSVEEVVVDAETDRISESGGRLVRIEGLSKLERLREVVLTRTAFVDPSLAFLAEAQSVEVLVLRGITIRSLEFLEGLPELRALIIQGSSLDAGVSLCLASSDIEYVEISNSSLSLLPEVCGRASFDAVLNLSYNQLSGEVVEDSIDTLQRFRSTILVGNKVGEQDLSARERDSLILRGNPFEAVPEKYRRYIM